MHGFLHRTIISSVIIKVKHLKITGDLEFATYKLKGINLNVTSCRAQIQINLIDLKITRQLAELKTMIFKSHQWLEIKMEQTFTSIPLKKFSKIAFDQVPGIQSKFLTTPYKLIAAKEEGSNPKRPCSLNMLFKLKGHYHSEQKEIGCYLTQFQLQ